jgi:hypothetical protein
MLCYFLVPTNVTGLITEIYDMRFLCMWQTIAKRGLRLTIESFSLLYGSFPAVACVIFCLACLDFHNCLFVVTFCAIYNLFWLATHVIEIAWIWIYGVKLLHSIKKIDIIDN